MKRKLFLLTSFLIAVFIPFCAWADGAQGLAYIAGGFILIILVIVGLVILFSVLRLRRIRRNNREESEKEIS